MIDIDRRLNKLVKHISRQIAQDSRALANEQSHPRHSADESDDYIKGLKERPSSLRSIRDSLEYTLTRSQ